MNNKKQKLELTWIGKNNPEYDIANIEPRILEENPKLSNCFSDPNTENMLIHGDNLLALKALLPEYEGQIKCIYIDPPYNTGKKTSLSSMISGLIQMMPINIVNGFLLWRKG